MAVAEYGRGAHPVQHKCRRVPWRHNKAEVQALEGGSQSQRRPDGRSLWDTLGRSWGHKPLEMSSSEERIGKTAAAEWKTTAVRIGSN